MSLNLSCSFVIPKDVMAREVSDEMVLLDLRNGTYYGLDQIGTYLWASIAQGLPLNKTCEQMLERFDVDRSTLENDVLALVDDLRSKGLLAIKEKTE